MDISAIISNLFCKENKLESLSQKLPRVSHLSELSLLQKNKNRIYESDALLAVKLDPAVLEAQVTIEKNNCSKSKNDTNEMQHKNKKGSSLPWDFEKAMLSQRAALFSLSSQQFSLLMKYVDILRHQRIFLQKRMECAFCKNNGQPDVWYTTHALKDRKGRVKCPILRTFSCPRCGATGDQAHTIKYCPQT